MYSPPAPSLQVERGMEEGSTLEPGSEKGRDFFCIKTAGNYQFISIPILHTFVR
jgi:hypothetical protein